jgi:hypothetical protein
VRRSHARSLSSSVQGRDSMTEICDGVWKAISHFGRKIVQAGLTASRFGNISVRVGDQVFITCTGSMLDEIGEAQEGAPWIWLNRAQKTSSRALRPAFIGLSTRRLLLGP